MMPSMGANVFGMEAAEIQEVVAGLGEPTYRARQIYCWLYKKRARGFAEMSDLSGFSSSPTASN